ncbi:Ammonium transporter Rh type B [Hypsibius exemplaris]|uniref:Ammonium transporter Rh type B n=1 Tax=Hypsibius exemplaris TaxID=2072580 RepID=A0A1W0WPW2_HYPEX|nr:Ammonium transporter Rh type B [Hypsibius exemplaris]
MAHDEAASGKKFAFVLLAFQVVFIVLFGVFAEYHWDAKPQSHRPADANGLVKGVRQADAAKSDAPYNPDYAMKDFYPMFQDVHVMMFIGFGYLMTFLRKYGYSSLGINFLLAAFVIQWATLMRGFLHMHDGKFMIDLTTLLTADFGAAAILITFGAVLGKLSPLQYLIMALIEVSVLEVNEWVGVKIFKTLDVGGSIFVHVFGAYFGLACSRVLSRWEYSANGFNTLKYTTKTTDLFSMVGTIFLWMFWPSFNSVMAPAELQQRAVINTYFALASCCVATFICSFLFHHGKISMEMVQNATLAGGVAIGSTADMVVNPYGALIIGFGAGVLSCVGIRFINGILESKLKVHDTCGVNNLHGMPGILAALISAVVCATASESVYGSSYYKVFPSLEKTEENENPRTPLLQAAWQLSALGMTLGVALLSGALTGSVLRLKIFDPLPGPAMFDDEAYFAMPEDVPPEQEREIRNRLQSASRSSYELAVPLSGKPIAFTRNNED